MARPPAWDDYEDAVMSGDPDVPVPPEDYEMSQRFREWVLERMRAEVAAQVGGAGLDRMAILRSEDAEEEPEAEEPGSGGQSSNGRRDHPA